jgi:hypothetical protein
MKQELVTCDPATDGTSPPESVSRLRQTSSSTTASMSSGALVEVPLANGAELAVGLGWSLALDRRARGLALQFRHPQQAPFDVEIAITSSGPVVRASAVALEIDSADEIVARCDRFSIQARSSVEIAAPEITCRASGTVRAEGREVDVVANAGDVRLRANDDVQLLGEQILLNCERQPPPPTWIPRMSPSPEVVLRRQDTSGELELLDPSSPK